MKRSLVGFLDSNSPGPVRVQGWIQSIRSLKNRHFVVLRDSSGVIQVTLDSPSDELAAVVSQLTIESVVTIDGDLVRNDHVRLRGMEIIPRAVRVENSSAVPLPFSLSGWASVDIDTRTNWRFFDLRRPENLLVFRLQTAAEHAMREFWLQNKFIEIHSPKLMGSPSESGAELFELEYFGRKAYLAQSPQFYKQMAMAAGFDRVFEVGPVFRANPSFTSRHDTEFTSVDVELSWVDSHEDVMQLEERWLAYVLEKLAADFGDEIQRTFGVDLVIPKLPFPRISMREARTICSEEGHSFEGDLDPAAERLLGSYAMRKFNHEFAFITEYPITVRPFYHMRFDDRPDVTKSFDLLWKGLEVTTGAQREHRYEVLQAQAREKGLRLEPIQYYLDFFRFGCPPHGGFGFGLTRMLMTMLGVKNVREVTFLYRSPNRLHP
jgi:nondiscriminating aspartyl-tRNA synthetase